jgi:hypothetical protein
MAPLEPINGAQVTNFPRHKSIISNNNMNKADRNFKEKFILGGGPWEPYQSIGRCQVPVR